MPTVPLYLLAAFAPAPALTAADLAAYLYGLVIVMASQSLLGGLMFYRVLEKGHQPGWAAFIPFYNYALVFKMTRKSPALSLIFVDGFIPVIGIIFSIIGLIFLATAAGNAFGKSGGFIVGLILLAIVFFPILGFGSSRYIFDGDAEPRGFDVLPPIGTPSPPQ